MGKTHLGGCIIQGDIGTFAPQVWDRLIEKYNPSTYIDVGCGAGHSLKYFIDKGLDGIGVEGYMEAINSSSVKDNIVVHDYTESEFIPSKKIDLAWCCEFVEHVEEKYSNNFMKTFENCKYVAMTHGVPGQPGFHHVNCQPAEYWINRFKNIGFSYLENDSLELRGLLPSYTYNVAIDKFLDINGNIFIPNGAHVRNTLMIFKNNK
jgi:hypothetical protein